MQFCGSRPQKALLWLGQGFICFIVMSTHLIMTGKYNVGPLFGPGAIFFFWLKTRTPGWSFAGAGIFFIFFFYVSTA